MTRLAPSLALAAVALIGTAATASATKPPAAGHQAVVVCHNVTHNPHIIVVDDDSTKLHAHLAHRTQSQLMDLVEGYDGTAAQIRAACVPKPTPTTIPTTATPSPTTTGSTPSATTTSSTTAPSPTSSTITPSPSATDPSHSSTPSSASSTPTSSTVAPSSASSTRSTHPTAPISSPDSPRRSVPSSTVAPPEQLAFTGVNVTLAALGAVLLAAGIALSRKGARRGQH